MPGDLPAPRSTLRDSHARVLVWCKARHRLRPHADLLTRMGEGQRSP